MKNRLLIIMVMLCGVCSVWAGDVVISGCSVTKDGKSFPLYGKVEIVTSFPDLKVQIVDSFADVNVKLVDSFPDDCGKVQIVNSFADVKVQIVDAFPDIKVKIVDSFPGVQ